MRQKFVKLLVITVLIFPLQACEMLVAGGVAGVFAYFLGNKAGQRNEQKVKNEALVEVRREMEEKQKAVSSVDQNIGNDINQRLVAGSVDQQLAIYPEVKNGVVILHGRVPDAKTADKIIQTTRQAPGVSRIISNLVVVNQQTQAQQAQLMQQQRYGGQIATPQQYPQQVMPIQQVQQPVMQQPTQQYYQPQYQYPQYQQQPVRQNYIQPSQQYYQPQQQPVMQPQQPQYPQYQQQPMQQQQQQYQYPAGQQRSDYPPADSTEKKSLNSAEALSEEKKNLRRAANQNIYHPEQTQNYQYQQAPPKSIQYNQYYQQQNQQYPQNYYAYPQYPAQQYNVQPQLLPENTVNYYQDNDSTYNKMRPEMLNRVQNLQNNINIPLPVPSDTSDADSNYIPINSYNGNSGSIDLQNIPIPTPSITEDYDESYRPLGSFAPEGRLQYTSPAIDIPVPTPSVTYDQDEYYRPLGYYNPQPIQYQQQPTNFQYISPQEEPYADEPSLDAPVPAVGDNDENYYYFY